MVENALRAANTGIGALGIAPLAAQFPVAGMIALERGFIFTSMVLAALTVALIDGRYRSAAAWALVAAGISATGLMHGYRITEAGVVNAYGPSTTWPYVMGYLAIAAVFFVLGRGIFKHEH